jgi:zinc protease
MLILVLTEEEILAAKSNLINGFPLRIDSNNKLLENVSNIAWQELPLDTLDIWTKQLERVTKEDIQNAFKNI